MDPPSDEALLVRYLLDTSSEAERVHVEEQFFASDDAFARLREVEDELLTRYGRGELSPGERTQLENAYRRPPRRDRMLFHAALRQVASTIRTVSPINLVSPAPQSWRAAWRRWLTFEPAALRLTLAAMTAVLAIAVSATTWQVRQLRTALDAALRDKAAFQRASEASAEKTVELERRAAAESTRAAPPTATPSGSVPASRPLIATFVLPPGLTRGAADSTRIVIPRTAAAIRLQLDLETAGEYKRFSAELRSDAGDLVWGPEMLRPQNTRWGRTLPLTLPADVVSDGEYEIILRGVVEKSEFEDSGHYYFAAVRR